MRSGIALVTVVVGCNATLFADPVLTGGAGSGGGDGGATTTTGDAVATMWEGSSGGLAPDGAQFISVALRYQGGDDLLPADLPQLSRYDALILSPWFFDTLGGSFADIHENNPNATIFYTREGAEVATYEDDNGPRDNVRLGRYDVARDHSMGAVNVDHPEFFLLDADGERVYRQDSDPPPGETVFVLDHGNPDLAAYWAEATLADLIDVSWGAEGIYIPSPNLAYSGGTYNRRPASYPDDDVWGDAYVSFAGEVTRHMRADGAAVVMNLGTPINDADVARWLAIDDADFAPDVALAGAFVVQWGTGDDAQFFPPDVWERQLQLFSDAESMRVWISSHTDLAPGTSGIANDGRPVSFEDALWYALGSYLLARPDVTDEPRMHFSFTGAGGNRLWWFPEYELDLGPAVDGYGAQTVGEAVVYVREFRDGFVVVNPSTTDALGIALPQPASLLTRETLQEPAPGPAVSSFDLQSHRAAFLRNNSI